MVIIEPDSVQLIVSDECPESVHTLGAIARMRRAYSLPTMRRRADLAVNSDRGGIRVIFQIICVVKCIELSVDPGTLISNPVDPLFSDTSRPNEDRIHRKIGKAHA